MGWTQRSLVHGLAALSCAFKTGWSQQNAQHVAHNPVARVRIVSPLLNETALGDNPGAVFSGVGEHVSLDDYVRVADEIFGSLSSAAQRTLTALLSRLDDAPDST
jgi:hypothetical protein